MRAHRSYQTVLIDWLGIGSDHVGTNSCVSVQTPIPYREDTHKNHLLAQSSTAGPVLCPFTHSYLSIHPWVTGPPCLPLLAFLSKYALVCRFSCVTRHLSIHGPPIVVSNSVSSLSPTATSASSLRGAGPVNGHVLQ